MLSVLASVAIAGQDAQLIGALAIRITSNVRSIVTLLNMTVATWQSESLIALRSLLLTVVDLARLLQQRVNVKELLQ